MTLYFIDKDQKYNVQIDGANFNSIVPEYQFDKINLEDKILTLIYHYEIQNRRVQKQIIIDLKKYISKAIGNLNVLKRNIEKYKCV